MHKMERKVACLVNSLPPLAEHIDPLLRAAAESGDGGELAEIVFVAHFVTMSDFTGEIIARRLRPALLERMGLNADLLERAREECRPRIAGISA